MKEKEEEIISAYQTALNNKSGEIIMRHLREVARMDDFSIDPELRDTTLRSYHYMGKLVNYIEYIRTRENFTRPLDDDDQIPGIIQNEI